MARTQQVVCDLCGATMEKEDYPPEPSPIEVQLNQLLHNIDPAMWGSIYEAGGDRNPLMNRDDVQFDACSDCVMDIIDFEKIKEKYEGSTDVE